MRMKKRWLAIAALLTASPLSTPATAQPADAGQSERYAMSAAAVTRALNICSGLWQGGIALDVIERELNGRDITRGELAETGELTIDHEARQVEVDYLPGMPPRIVVWRPVLGCVQLPVGATAEMIDALPRVPDEFRAPDLDDHDWPTGDRNARGELPADIQGALDEIVESAFDETAYGGRTWGVLVVHQGRIVAERYAPGFGPHIGSQTHSAAKSFTSTIIGLATDRGLLQTNGDNLLQAWRRPGDPRARIRLENLLHMASGLYGEGNSRLFLDVYMQGGAAADLIPTNFMTARPGSRFVYNPGDTMLLMRSLREAMQDDQAYFRFPYEQLFWRIGMTRTTMNSDWNGDIFGSGQSWSTARDFARFGLLYLNDGVWEGERILPEGWRDYVTTPAPAQRPSGPRYGAQFWLYGESEGLPEDAFTPQGGQGQFAMIVPSRDTVIVRRGIDGASGFDIAGFSAEVLEVLR